MKLIKFTLFLLAVLIIIPYVFAGTVTRSFSPTTATPGESMEVTLTVTIDAGETYYSIDETYPTGWAVSNNGGGDIATTGHLKWVVISGVSNTAYKYTLSVPAGASGSGSFSGKYMFEGDAAEQTIGGSNSLSLITAPAICTESAPEGTKVGKLTDATLSACAQAGKVGGITKVASGVDDDLCQAVYRGVPLIKVVPSGETVPNTYLSYGKVETYSGVKQLFASGWWETLCPSYFNSIKSGSTVPEGWAEIKSGSSTHYNPVSKTEAMKCIDDSPTAFNLFNSACVKSCLPECTGKSCGNDGCGGSCGSCASNEFCDVAGACTLSCSDSDSSFSPSYIGSSVKVPSASSLLTKGTVTGIGWVTKQAGTSSDTCNNLTSVVEFYCENVTHFIWNSYDCPVGSICDNGACFNPEYVAPADFCGLTQQPSLPVMGDYNNYCKDRITKLGLDLTYASSLFESYECVGVYRGVPLISKNNLIYSVGKADGLVALKGLDTWSKTLCPAEIGKNKDLVTTSLSQGGEILYVAKSVDAAQKCINEGKIKFDLYEESCAPCTPVCGNTCGGDNSCGGVCGCAKGEVCNTNNKCIQAPPFKCPTYSGAFGKESCESVPGCGWEMSSYSGGTGKCVSFVNGLENGPATGCASYTAFNGNSLAAEGARKEACVAPCTFNGGKDNSAVGDACKLVVFAYSAEMSALLTTISNIEDQAGFSGIISVAGALSEYLEDDSLTPISGQAVEADSPAELTLLQNVNTELTNTQHSTFQKASKVAKLLWSYNPAES